MRHRFPSIQAGVVALVIVVVATSCGRQASGPAHQNEAEDNGLARVGSLTIYPEDLDHHLVEKHGGRTNEPARSAALLELVHRARGAQAALDAGMASDPVVRAEMARLLESRFRQQQLNPRLKALPAIPEARLRELYEASGSRFQSPEKRQVAVLWLNPGRDPERTGSYVKKLTEAREWLLQNKDLTDHPEKGFSVLSVDHSEHHASRFKNGVMGWLERAGGMSDWQQAVAAIAYSIPDVGEVSPVVTRPEGVFLVRVMDRKPAVRRSFDVVAAQLEREERGRLRLQIESEFDESLKAGHEVEWLTSEMPEKEAMTRRRAVPSRDR